MKNGHSKSSDSKKVGELEELIDEMGQEDEEKAAKVVIEVGDAEEKAKQQRLDDTLTFFTDQRKTFRDYYDALARQIKFLLDAHVDWLQLKFKYEVTVNKARGVGVILEAPDGKIFARGFKPNGEPKYDVNAIKVLIYQTENVVEDYAKEQAHREDLRRRKAN